MTNGHPRLLAAILVLAVAVLLGGFAYYLVDATRRADRAEKAIIALCALRADLDKRIAVSQGLLDAHPHATKIGGFDRGLFVNNVANSTRTRATLSILDC